MSSALEIAPPLVLSRFTWLTAEWRHLCLVTYAVEPERLLPHLPPGLALDTRDGKAFVSLVAFDFQNTRVLGGSWPGYRNFPEINLRFYVRDGETRGVAFVREFVPSYLVAFLARALYNEPYQRARMESAVRESEHALEVEHLLRVGGRTQRLRVLARRQDSVPAETSTAHFFKEHTFGFGRTRAGGLVRYEVRHPIWATYPVENLHLDWEFGTVYGPEWADLSRRDPVSVILAKGSAVRVGARL
jgi:uncharacterized protein YqjF (DUF2071 family)